MGIGWSEKGLAICSEFGLGWAKQCVRILVGNGQIVTTKSLINTTPIEPRGIDDVCVQSATQWTASVHTLHMFKPVMTFVFKVLRNGLLRYILYTCPNL